MVSGSVPDCRPPKASTAGLTNYSTGSSDVLAQKCTGFGCCPGSLRRFLGSVLNIYDIVIDLFRRATLQFQRGSDLLRRVVDHRHRVTDHRVGTASLLIETRALLCLFLGDGLAVAPELFNRVSDLAALAVGA
jgi:hypothetical protein